MKTYNTGLINGELVTLHGTQVIDLINPSNNEVIGKVTMADETDTRNAIAAAKKAFVSWSQTTKEERLNYLQKLYDAEMLVMEELVEATITEYGAPQERAIGSNALSANIFQHVKATLNDYQLVQTIGQSQVFFEPVGVVAIFTPWNSSAGSMHIKLAPALAAGCTVVIKPSEMSAMQTDVLMKVYHSAGLPPGVINVICGLGEVVGKTLSLSADIQKIAFTGSTQIGKIIAKDALNTMKRFTLELGGKSPNIILDDADFEIAIPMAVRACFLNNGQACIAASRLLVPKDRLQEVIKLAKATAESMKVGDPRDPEVILGPLASLKQYDRVQQYIQIALEEKAELVTGGPGHPAGLESGNFVKPTIFAGVTNDMTIAREEVFGPVLAILTYQTEEEAISIANDTEFGLIAYVSSSDHDRALAVARKIQAGRVLINTIGHDPLTPFGGFKQSGIGREGGILGLEEYLEPKAIITA
ncbi:aldehyde dehydrogenase family protein [Pedobacter lithocola]|uniref:aldehyde dehydrogenase (NAD(+)) n=1 Tax=Pedobacter lithocola TaxID=1908239 RepID=A0ABV8P8K0_9SPHI